jgi:hypothetical protein
MDAILEQYGFSNLSNCSKDELLMTFDLGVSECRWQAKKCPADAGYYNKEAARYANAAAAIRNLEAA